MPHAGGGHIPLGLVSAGWGRALYGTWGAQPSAWFGEQFTELPLCARRVRLRMRVPMSSNRLGPSAHG